MATDPSRPLDPSADPPPASDAPDSGPPTRSGPRAVPDEIRGVPVAEAVADLRLAFISRALDDREITLQAQHRVFFQISGAGHEALLLGLSHYLRGGHDWFFPYYRDRALMLGIGISPTELLLQSVGSVEDPSSAGRQMPCHWGHAERHVVTQSSPTGSQCLPAVGCAEATRYASRRPDLPGVVAHGDELTYVSLGEGACSEGEFWESLNTACTLHLPILYVVEDNGYAISVPTSDQQPAPVADLVRGFAGLEVHRLDGTDYFEVRERAQWAIAHVRAGVGPALIHAQVTRPYSHSGADTQSKYRTESELEWEAERDPIQRLGQALVEAGILTEAQLDQMRKEAFDLVAQSAKEAMARTRPDPGRITEHVVELPELPDPGPPPDPHEGEAGREPVRLGEAIRRTLFEQMAGDERIRVFGEDVADARDAVLAQVEGKGGVFGTTRGLQREFGMARCYNTPLAEANIVGRGVGQAIRGLRPAVEIQFFDYIWPAMQQITSEAATIRWRSAGAYSCPLVMRVPIGGYLQGGAIWHSQCGESIFAHIPGLLIAFPSRARDAAGLLRTAFRCEDPVLFFEHKHLLRQPYTEDPYPPGDWMVPFGRGDIRRPGTDLTVVTWGAMVQKSLEAAATLNGEDGTDAEVIDLRTITPWDQEMVAESVARTGKLLVAHEDRLTCGFGAEVAAWVASECFTDLDAPVARLGALDTFVPYEPSLEDAVLPQTAGVVAAIRDLAAF